jgi:hypothetical protein
MARFQAERGDLLLWLQSVLIEESQSARRTAIAAPPASGVRGSASAEPASVRLPVRAPVTRASAVVPAGDPARRIPGSPSDPATGARTLLSLHRDLVLLRSWPGSTGKPVTLLAMRIDPVSRPADPSELLRAIVDGGRRALRERDRIYRTGPSELSILMPGADEIGAEIAVARLEAATVPILAERGLPSVRIRTRVIDPALVVGLDGSRTASTSAQQPAAVAG